MNFPSEYRVTLDQATLDAGLMRGRIERSRAVHAAFSALWGAVGRVFARPARLRAKPHGAGCAA